MSISVPPPEFQFSTLFYNPAWWITSTGSLTQSTANQLYLRKTVTDSASAMETFNAGIKSSSYDVTNPSLIKYLYSSQTADANLFENMGSSSTLKLGNQVTTQSVHVSYIDCKGNSINNANAPLAGNLIIGSSQTTGQITLGGASRTTGAINTYKSLTPLYTTFPASTEIGYTFKLTNFYTVNTAMSSGSDFTVVNTTNFPAGTWLITGGVFLAPAATTLIQYVNASIGGTYATFNISSAGNYAVNTNICPPVSGIFYSSGTTTLQVIYRVGFSVSTLTIQGGQSLFNIHATRIA